MAVCANFTIRHLEGVVDVGIIAHTHDQILSDLSSRWNTALGTRNGCLRQQPRNRIGYRLNQGRWQGTFGHTTRQRWWDQAGQQRDQHTDGQRFVQRAPANGIAFEETRYVHGLTPHCLTPDWLERLIDGLRANA